MSRKKYTQKRRTRLETALEVLKAVDGGECKPTRIMYESNLSWSPALEILDSLTKQGLLEVKETRGEIGADKRSRKEYSITEKGQQVLKHFRKGGALIDEANII